MEGQEEGKEWSYQSEVPEWGREDWIGTPIAVRPRSRSPSIIRLVEDDYGAGQKEQ